jgi:hypothetical protein
VKLSGLQRTLLEKVLGQLPNTVVNRQTELSCIRPAQKQSSKALSGLIQIRVRGTQ